MLEECGDLWSRVEHLGNCGSNAWSPRPFQHCCRSWGSVCCWGEQRNNWAWHSWEVQSRNSEVDQGRLLTTCTIPHRQVHEKSKYQNHSLLPFNWSTHLASDFVIHNWISCRKCLKYPLSRTDFFQVLTWLPYFNYSITCQCTDNMYLTFPIGLCNCDVGIA